MSMRLFDWASRRLSNFDPEFAHWLTVTALRCGFYKNETTADDQRFSAKSFGLDFKNPLGIAAGFDKNAQAVAPLLNMGLAFVKLVPLRQNRRRAIRGRECFAFRKTMRS